MSRYPVRFSTIACVIALVGCSSSDDAKDVDGGAGAAGSATVDSSVGETSTDTDTDAAADPDAETPGDASLDSMVDPDAIAPTIDSGSDAGANTDAPRPDAQGGGVDATADAISDARIDASTADGGDAGKSFCSPDAGPPVFSRITPTSPIILNMEGPGKFSQAVPQDLAGNWDLVLPFTRPAGATSSPEEFVTLSPPRGTSNHAIHTTGSNFDGLGGVGVALLGAFAHPLDASGYAGFSFYAKGSADTTKLGVEVGLTSTIPEHCMCEPGGNSIPSRCYDNPFKDITLTSDWQKFTVAWADLRQDGYGNPVPTDPSKLLNVVFRARLTGDGSSGIRWDFWVDDIAFETTVVQ